jgi:UDP-N-acetylglucosamine 2-epimerase
MDLDILKSWSSIQQDNFTFWDTTDLVPLYKKADILFADTTSAIQEFLLQKKPVVTFNHTFDYEYLIHVNEPEKIEDGFIQALKKPAHLLEKIDAFIQNLHPYFDGKSSERIINTTIHFLHKDKSYLSTKPLDLIRKFKIRKKLGYYTLKSYRRPFTIKKKN